MKKYIVTTAGGLGNQMFNYSVWYFLKYKKHKNAILYPKQKDLLDHNGYEINRIFTNTQYPSPPNRYIDKYINIQQFINRYISFVKKRIGLSFINKLFIKGSIIKLIEFPNWDNYTFISEILPDLKLEFKFPFDSDERNVELIQKITECESVSIHIRRGDYQNSPRWRMILGDICNKKYYEDAIQLVLNKKKNPYFFVFSDDIDWVKENLNIPNATFINWNKKENSFRDMQLMASCKTNIIANSTFSLMSTWLNDNQNCWHIVPKKWRNYYNDQTYKKYIPNAKDWTIIDNDRPNVSIILSKPITEKDMLKILRQSYTDFELIISHNQNIIHKDKRIKTKLGEIHGNHIFECEDTSVYTDRNYLSKQLYLYLDEK